GDATTVLAQVHKIRDEFGIRSVVLVGDRGMISQKQIDQIRQLEDIDWITALKTGEIRKLLENEALQMGLFDERNLFELTDPGFRVSGLWPVVILCWPSGVPTRVNP